MVRCALRAALPRGGGTSPDRPWKTFAQEKLSSSQSRLCRIHHAIRCPMDSKKGVTQMDIKTPEGLGNFVSRLAQTNIELWHEEDKARDPDDAKVAKAKRAIDQLNQ